MFLVYMATSPSDRFYIGYTGMTLAERWRQHVVRALRGAHHPLSDAIRKYGAENFTVQVISTFETKLEAMIAESDAIATMNALQLGYNLSPGGLSDLTFGREKAEALRSTPEGEARYRVALSAGCKASELHQAARQVLTEKAAEWRRANPREAWKNAYRASRVAKRLARGGGFGLGSVHSDQARENMKAAQQARRQAEGRLCRLRHGRKARVNAKAQWAARTPEEIAALSAVMRESLRAFNATLMPEEKAVRDSQLAEARKSIDHEYRKARQREAIAAYWTPERRAAKAEENRRRFAAKKANR